MRYGLIDWMVFYATFNSISVISRSQLTLFMSFLGFASTRLGLWSVLPKDTPMKKPRGSSVERTQDPWISTVRYGVSHKVVTHIYVLYLNSFPNNKSGTVPNWKSLQTTILNLMKMAENSPKGWKTWWEKGEIAHHGQFLLFLQCF